ncbi:ESPR-type extended signal peptide-containing protein [Variovorax sp. EBFNA2]|uniref:ESPR-type extended signal peptide-containing protein n=1 Tax=Variovorax sp. EBFNA2 TaxID=3342097 RepID=UPI0029C0E3CB|nr:ESPR-type extended signal peptide-containing protein [Variovorax boronicumulans]WPG41118.1 ESPR-type extended signal peptide-containing protein [Variovorax boronicumulans]
MNKSYRSIWNESLGAWVAASEATRARGKRGSVVRAAVTAGVMGAALLGAASNANAQAAITDYTGHASPDPVPGAVLDINSYTRGVMMPRVALTDATTWGLPGGVPADGMMLFNTTAGTTTNGLTQGLVTWKGGRWVSVDETPYLHVNSTVVGNSTQANSGALGVNSTAIGPDAKAIGSQSVAMGLQAQATGLRAVAIGENTKADGVQAFAAGYGAKATSTNSIAIGTGAVSEGTAAIGNIALGAGAKAQGSQGAIAIGLGAEAPSQRSIYIGEGAGKGAGIPLGSMGVGYNAGQNSSGGYNAAVGYEAGQSVSGSQNTAMGNGSQVQVTGNNNTGVGNSSGRDVRGSGNTGVGNNAGSAVTGSNNVGVGPNAGYRVSGANNVATGYFAGSDVTGEANVANGSYAGSNVSGSSNVASGSFAGFGANGNNNVAMGNTAGQGIGTAAQPVNDTVAIGTSSLASKANAIAIGKGAQATGTSSISIGTGNKVSGDNSGAIGDPNIVSGSGSYALGNNNTIASDNAFAMGNNVTIAAGLDGAVGIGNGSTVAASTVTSYAPNGATVAGTAIGSNVVSVGASGAERRVSNVAAGGADTDAVNVSQLKAAQAAATTHYFSVNDTGTAIPITPAIDGTNFNNDGALGVETLAAGQHATAESNYTTALGARAFAGDPTGTGAAPNATAVGAGAYAAAESATALGASAYAPDRNTTAVGTGASASGEFSTALGAGSRAEIWGSTALGADAVASGAASTAAGRGARAQGWASTALGEASTASDEFATAVGSLSRAGQHSTAVGQNSSANSWEGTAVGQGSVAEYRGTAIGQIANASGQESTAVGQWSQATSQYATALGQDSHATAKFATALGQYSQATQVYSTAVGQGSLASNENTTAVGQAAQAPGLWSTAVGQFSQSIGERSTSVGQASRSDGAFATAVGQEAQSTGDNSVAVGMGTIASGLASTAAGQYARAIGDHSTALGQHSYATKIWTTAVGEGAVADGDNSTAVGQHAEATGTYSSAIGQYATAAGAYGTSLGQSAQADGERATSLGQFSKATGVAATAVGQGAQATAGSGVALGANSIADTKSFLEDPTRTGYVPTGVTTAQAAAINATNSNLGAVSVGDAATGKFRQITNVAAGTVDTDAVNVSQLKAVNAAMAAGATHYYSVSSTVTGAGSNYGNDGATGANALAAGVNASANGDYTIAIGSDAKATNAGGGLAVDQGGTAVGRTASARGNATAAFGSNANADGQYNTAIGAGTVAGGDATTGPSYPASSGNTAVGGRAKAVGVDSTALGGSANALGTSATAQGAGAQANGDYTTAVGSLASALAKSGTALGLGSSVTHEGSVALGSQSVANGSTLGNAAYSPTGNLADVAGTKAAGEVSVGGIPALAGGAVVHRRITNVAAGAEPTDAVNVSQLRAGQTHYYSVNDAGVRGGNYANEGAQGKNSLAAGVNARTASGAENAVALGNNANATLLSSVAIGDGATATGGAGVLNGNNAGALAIGTKANASGAQAAAIGTGSQASGQTSIALGVGSNASSSQAVAIGTGSEASKLAAVAVGGGANASAAFASALGSGAIASATSASAFGNGSEASVASGVALGALSVANTAAGAVGYDPATGLASTNASATWVSTLGAVSVGGGANGDTRQITNVAAGTENTDAVNVAQLKATQTHYFSVNSSGGGNYDNTGALGIDSIAIGKNAATAAAATSAVAIGTGAAAKAASGNGAGVAIGAGATAESGGGGGVVAGLIAAPVAIGNGATGVGNGALALGDSTRAINSSVAMGAGALAGGPSANASLGSAYGQIAIGPGARAGADATGVGVTGAIAIGTRAVASTAGQLNTIALGSDTLADAAGAVAIGDQAKATAGQGVALGAGSVATQSAAALALKEAYKPAGVASVAGTPMGEVSVGSVGKERRITNLAAGSDDTDAVNVSQLKAVDATANAGWNVAANGEATGGNVAPGAKVDFSNSDSNITITRTGTDLDVKLADDVKVNNSVTVGQSVLNTTGLTVNDGAGNVTTTSATGSTVTNGTTTTAVAAGGVTSGNVKLSGVSNDIQGLSNTTLTDPSFATVGRAATEEQLKLVDTTANKGWNVAANGEATGGNVAPGGKVDFSNSDSNIAITRTGTDLDFKLVDDVKVNNSVTVGQSVLNTTGLTVNNGTTTTQVAAGGVTSGDVKLSGVTNDIQGLSNKTLTDPSFATVGRGATEEQLKLVNDTASAGWNVAANGEATGGNVAPGGKVDFSNSDSNIAITRSGTNLDLKLADDVKVNNSVTVGQSVLNTTGLTVNDGAGNVTTTSATGSTVTNGTTTTAMAAGGVTSGTVNLSGVTNDIRGLSNTTLTDPSFATVGRGATEEQLKIVNDTASAGWNVAANGEATGGNVAPGAKVDFSNSDSNIAITRTGTDLDVKLADDVKVNNSVTVGQSVLNTTGLTVNNGTTTTSVAAGGVTSGDVKLSGVSNDIQGLSNKTLTDPSFATVGRGATEEQLKIVNDTASAGWNVAANGEATGGNVAPGGKVDFSNSDSNIAITRTGTDLDVKLADDVKVNNSVTVGQSVLNTTGLTVNNGTTTTAVAAGGVTSGNVNLSGVSNDIQGLSNTTLTDPSFATVGRAATEEQLKLVDTTANKGWNVAANGEATGGNVAPGGKVDFSNSDSNITITRTGTDLDVKLADDVKVNNSVTVGQSVLNTTGLTVNNGTTTTAVAAGGVTSGNVNLSGVTNDIKGLSNTTLSDPTFATVGRGATEEQLKLVNNTASAGWNVAANGEATGGNVAPGSKVDFSNSDSNIAITRSGTNLDLKLADDVKVNNSVTVGQSVLNTTGLTVNNGTTTTAVAAGGVTSGSVNLSGVTNDIKGLSNKTLTDPTFATVGRGATEEQLRLVNDTASAGWNVAANGEATGGNVAPGGKVDFSNSDSNIAITRSGTDLDFKLADDVKVNNSVTVGQSVLNTTGLTVNDGAGNVTKTSAAGTTVTNGTTTTVVAAGGVTSGTVNLSGVTNDIKGLSNTTLTDPSFATVGRGATEEQLKIVNDTANTGWNVAANGEAIGGNVAPGGKVDFSNSDSNVTITRTGTNLDVKLADDVKVNNSVTVGQSVLNTTGLTVNDGAGNVTKTTASGTTVTNGTTSTVVAAGGVTSGSVNLSGVTNDIKGLSNTTLTDPSFATVGRGATEEQLKIVNDTASAGWNVAANGEATGGNVAPGGKVDFSNSDSNVTITRTGTDLDFKLADDVKVNNSVTVGQSVLNTTGLTVNDGAGNVTKTSAAGTTVTNGTTTTVVAAGGVTSGTVNLSGVSNDIKGLSNKTLTDPSFATVGRAATEEQLKLVDTTASKGWNLSANGEATPQNIAPGGTANFANGDNMVVTRNGNTLTVATAKDVKFDSVTTGDTVMNNAGVTVGPNVTLGATGLTIVGGPSVTTAGVNAGGKVITNVAPGVANTDAVNVSQLKDTVAESKTKYYSVNSTGGGNENNDGATGVDAIASGKDAQATAANAVAMGTAAQAAGISATSIGNAAWAMGDRSTAVGYFSGAYGIDSAAFGHWARAVGDGSLAAGAYSRASGVASVAVGGQSGATGDFSLALGAGSTATAYGGAALGAGSVAGRTGGVQGYVPPGATAAQSDAIAATTSTTGAVGVGDVAKGVFRQITGVAAGSALSDAVNVAQLQAVASQAAAAGSKWITGSPTTYVAPTSTGTDSTAVGSGAVVKADQGVAVGTGAVVTTKNSVALGNNSTTSDAKPTEAVTLQGTTYQFAGTKPVGVVSVGSEGNERQITNVAAGEISATSTNAVNGSQLYATNQAINSMTTGGGGIKYFHANSKAADSSADGAESVAIGPKAVATGSNSIATGNGAQAQAAGSIALGANSTASTASSVALGEGAVANRAGMNGQREMFSNTVVQSAQGAVSVGSTGNERQITNVAGGTQATDAVNVRQLQAVQQSAVRYDTNVDGSVNYNSVTMGNGASTGPVTVQNVAPGVAPTDAVNVQQLNQAGAANTAYTDARTNALGSEIRNVAKNAYAGVAAAMAVQMPGTSVPGKTVMRVGYGTFKGESAVGISFRRTAENNGWSVTGGVGMSRAGAAATVGAEWVFN